MPTSGTVYPGSIDSFDVRTVLDVIAASEYNQLLSAVEALQAQVGILTQRLICGSAGNAYLNATYSTAGSMLGCLFIGERARAIAPVAADVGSGQFCFYVESNEVKIMSASGGITIVATTST